MEIKMNWTPMYPDISVEDKKKRIAEIMIGLGIRCPYSNIRKTSIICYLHGVLDGLDNLSIQIIFNKINEIATS